jgi:acetyl-CoA C-acetyltransferase
VAERYEVSRADMDKYAQRSQELAVQSQETGYFDREIVPVTLEDGTVVAKDDGPARQLDAREALAAAAGLQGGRQGHRRQLVPAERRRGRASSSCRPTGERARPQAARPHHRPRRRRQRARVHGRRADLARSGRRSTAPGMTIDNVDTVELKRGVRRQVIPIMAECDIPLEKMNPHGGAIALGHPFGHDRRRAS